MKRLSRKEVNALDIEDSIHMLFNNLNESGEINEFENHDDEDSDESDANGKISRSIAEEKYRKYENKIKEFQSKLSLRDELLETLRKAYYRDVITIKDDLLGKEKRHDILPVLYSLPSTDLADTFPLRTPNETYLRIHSCKECGGHAEVVHTEVEELTNLRDELQASQKVQAQDKKTIHRIRNEMDEHAKNIGTLESTIKLLQRDKIESMELLKVAHMNESRMLIQERELRECRKNEKALQMHNERSSKLLERLQNEYQVATSQSNNIKHRNTQIEAELDAASATVQEQMEQISSFKEQIADLCAQLEQGTVLCNQQNEDMLQLQKNLECEASDKRMALKSVEEYKDQMLELSLARDQLAANEKQLIAQEEAMQEKLLKRLTVARQETSKVSKELDDYRTLQTSIMEGVESSRVEMLARFDDMKKDKLKLLKTQKRDQSKHLLGMERKSQLYEAMCMSESDLHVQCHEKHEQLQKLKAMGININPTGATAEEAVDEEVTRLMNVVSLYNRQMKELQIEIVEYKETIADLEVTQEAMGSALAASDEGNAGQASLKSETSFERSQFLKEHERKKFETATFEKELDDLMLVFGEMSCMEEHVSIIRQEFVPIPMKESKYKGFNQKLSAEVQARRLALKKEQELDLITQQRMDHWKKRLESVISEVRRVYKLCHVHESTISDLLGKISALQCALDTSRASEENLQLSLRKGEVLLGDTQRVLALERKEAEIVAQNFQDTSDNLMYSTNKCDLLTSEKKKLNMILTEREAELTDTKLVKNEFANCIEELTNELKLTMDVLATAEQNYASILEADAHRLRTNVHVGLQSSPSIQHAEMQTDHWEHPGLIMYQRNPSTSDPHRMKANFKPKTLVGHIEGHSSSTSHRQVPFSIHNTDQRPRTSHMKKPMILPKVRPNSALKLKHKNTTQPAANNNHPSNNSTSKLDTSWIKHAFERY